MPEVPDDVFEELIRHRMGVEILFQNLHDMKAALDGLQMYLRQRSIESRKPTEVASANRASLYVERYVRSLNTIQSIARQRSSPRVPLDALEICKRAVEVVGPPPSCKVEIDVEAGLLMSLDAGRATSMVIALLDNALQATYSARSAVIRIVGGRSNSNYFLDIVDNGCGMDESMLSMVFDPFMTTRPGSLGLGLFLARRVVESVGGSLTIDRSTPGAGTVFRLTWPTV